MTAASIRVQLLGTRLSLQEQRIRMVSDQLFDAQEALNAGENDRNARLAHMSRVEESMRSGTASAARIGDVEAMLGQLRQEVARSSEEQQALRVREQDLRRTLNAEQNRWIEFNSRLDQLERGLPSAR